MLPPHNNDQLIKKKIYLCDNKIMTKQSAHINVNLCDSPSIGGIFGYEWMIWNEAKCADFGNYLL